MTTLLLLGDVENPPERCPIRQRSFACACLMCRCGLNFVSGCVQGVWVCAMCVCWVSAVYMFVYVSMYAYECCCRCSCMLVWLVSETRFLLLITPSWGPSSKTRSCLAAFSWNVALCFAASRVLLCCPDKDTRQQLLFQVCGCV